MAEYTARFTTRRSGYDKDEVEQFIGDLEDMLQERSREIYALKQQILELETKLQRMTGGDSTVEERLELYDKLMKKMDGDYTNLLTPAIAKAKRIEEQAEAEYAARIDQARYSAEGIYDAAVERIAAEVKIGMDRMCAQMERYMHSKTLSGRIESLVDSGDRFSRKVAKGVHSASKKTANACNDAKKQVKTAAKTCRDEIMTFKKSD